MAAHLDSGLGDPDLHEVVLRPAGDAIAVWRDSHHVHAVRVTHRRALKILIFVTDASAGAVVTLRPNLPSNTVSDFMKSISLLGS